jgi:hypothetical protein
MPTMGIGEVGSEPVSDGGIREEGGHEPRASDIKEKESTKR